MNDARDALVERMVKAMERVLARWYPAHPVLVAELARAALGVVEEDQKCETCGRGMSGSCYGCLADDRDRDARARIAELERENDALSEYVDEDIEASRLRLRVTDLEAGVREAFDALEKLRALPNHIDPPEPCWCGWCEDIKSHAYVCQVARKALARLRALLP